MHWPFYIKPLSLFKLFFTPAVRSEKLQLNFPGTGFLPGAGLAPTQQGDFDVVYKR